MNNLELPLGSSALALPAETVAGVLGWNVKTLQNRLPTLGLPYVRIGRSTVFLPEDVTAFLRRHRVANDPAPVTEPEPVKRGRGRPRGSITRRHSGREG